MENKMISLIDGVIAETVKENNSFKIYDGEEGLNEICFPTELRKIGYCDNDGTYHESATNGFFDKRTNDLLYAGPQYVPTKNEEIVDNLKPLFNNGFKVHNVINHRDRKFEINLINPEVEMMMGSEKAHYRCLITNSYDGTSKLSLELGAYVFICSNGLKISYGKDISLKLKHTQDHNFGELMLDTSAESIEYVRGALSEKVWDLPGVDAKSQFKALTAGIKDKKDEYGKNVPSKAKRILDNRFQIECEKYQVEFALFMAATYLTTHGYKLGLSMASRNSIDKVVEKVFFRSN